MGIESMILDQEPDGVQKEKFSGVMTGIVKNNWDSKHPGQVEVELLMGEKGQTTTKWIRVMNPYCGNGYGEYFLPEIDTEVVVAFQHGELSEPIVLGCMWNSKDKLPEGKANDKNSIKSIRTKVGHEIIFDETKDKEKIEIKTKGKLDICLQDKEQIIVIKDSSGENLLQMDAKKGVITVAAKKELVMKAGGEEMLTLDGSGKKVKLSAGSIEINAKQNLKVKGQSTNIEGNMMEMKAQGSLKVESSAALQLKGAICKIN